MLLLVSGFAPPVSASSSCEAQDGARWLCARSWRAHPPIWQVAANHPWSMCAQFKANVGKADVSCSRCGTARSRLPWDWEPCKFAQLPPVQVWETLRRQSWISLHGAGSYGWIDWCGLDQWNTECFDSSSGEKLGRIHVSALPDRGEKSCNAISCVNRLQWFILSRVVIVPWTSILLHLLCTVT